MRKSHFKQKKGGNTLIQLNSLSPLTEKDSSLSCSDPNHSLG